MRLFDALCWFSADAVSGTLHTICSRPGRSTAPRFLLRRPPGPFFCHCASTSRVLCAKPTAPTHLDEDATHGTHVPAKKLAVITADTETIISRASGAGRLAWFGFGFRVAGSVQLECQKAPGIYWALVTKIGPSRPPVCARSDGLSRRFIRSRRVGQPS